MTIEPSTLIKSLTPTIDAISKRFAGRAELSTAEQSLLLSYLLYRDLEELGEDLETLKENVKILNNQVDNLNKGASSLYTDGENLNRNFINISKELGELRKRIEEIGAGVAERQTRGT